MTMKSLNPAQMEARVARFNRLQTYQMQNLATQGIPPARWRRSPRARSIR